MTNWLPQMTIISPTTDVSIITKKKLCSQKLLFLFLKQNMLWVLEEPSQWDDSFEHPKHMLKYEYENVHSFTLQIIVQREQRFFSQN